MTLEVRTCEFLPIWKVTLELADGDHVVRHIAAHSAATAVFRVTRTIIDQDRDPLDLVSVERAS